jgi:acyl dehydratase
MTEAFDPTQHRVAEPRWFEDLAVGERFFIPSRTMTEAHFASFQTISADNHPIITISNIAASAATRARSPTASRSSLSPRRVPVLLRIRSVTR